VGGPKETDQKGYRGRQSYEGSKRTSFPRTEEDLGQERSSILCRTRSWCSWGWKAEFGLSFRLLADREPDSMENKRCEGEVTKKLGEMAGNLEKGRQSTELIRFAKNSLFTGRRV